MKICHVIFSTNRIEYLKRTLSCKNKINYEEIEKVDRILIDDYPHGRKDEEIKRIALENDFTEIILNNENLGITKTWQKFFEIIKNRKYDFIFHQEDDVEIIENFKIKEVIEILQNDSNLSQVQLKRNNWYNFETEEIGPKNDDIIYKQYRYETGNPYFWMMSSLYPAWISQEPILQETGFNPAEGVIAYYLKTKYKKYSALLKTEKGHPMINHFGEYSQGKRCLENEPGWEKFKYYNPLKKYCSRTGKEIASI